MRSAGFTLIELLIVIAIIALLSLVGFVNFKDFAANQVIVKAAGEVQTLLRLAQSNATTSTLCNNQGATSWSLKFSNAQTIELRCNPSDYLYKTYTIANAQLSIKCDTTNLLLPATFTYSVGVGTLAISPDCLQSINFTISKPSGSSSNAVPQSFTISKGGAINVQ